MAKIPEKTLKWRRKQEAGAIMKTSTFDEIVNKCVSDHPDWDKKRCEEVAGSAYWKTVKAKARAKEVRKQLT